MAQSLNYLQENQGAVSEFAFQRMKLGKKKKKKGKTGCCLGRADHYTVLPGSCGMRTAEGPVVTAALPQGEFLFPRGLNHVSLTMKSHGGGNKTASTLLAGISSTF